MSVKIKKSKVTWGQYIHVAAKSIDNISELPAQNDDLKNLAQENRSRLSKKSRFWISDVKHVCYAADSEDTAIEEKLYHIMKIFSQSPKQYLAYTNYNLVALNVDRELEFCDIRNMKNELPDIYHDNNYDKSQEFAKNRYQRHHEEESGIVYDSLRHPEGQCLVIFTDEMIEEIYSESIKFEYDGERIHLIDGKNKKRKTKS